MTVGKKKYRLPVKYGSSTYVVLCYLKMKNKPVSVDNFRNFSVGKVRPSDISRSFDILVRSGLAKPYVKGFIEITETGKSYLFKIAQKDHRSESKIN